MPAPSVSEIKSFTPAGDGREWPGLAAGPGMRVLRVLHVLDPATCGDEGVLACACAMRTPAGEFGPEFRHEVWIVGRAEEERRAWSLGIDSTQRVSPRSGRLGGGTAGLLRRLWDDRRAGGLPEVVQCWSLEGLALARRVFGGGRGGGNGVGAPARVVVVMNVPTGIGRAGTAKMMAGGRDTDLATGREVLVAPHPRIRAWLGSCMDGEGEQGRWLHTVRLVEAPVPAPGTWPGRGAMRAKLGIAESESVVGLLADPPSAADAHRFAFASGVVFAAGRPITVLIRRGATHERRGAAFIRAHSRRWGMTLADLSLPELVAASDVVFVDSPPETPRPSAGPTALALAHAMGVPVVGFPGCFPRSDGPILMSPSGSLGRIAVPIVELLENERTRAAQADAARRWLDEARSRDGFGSTLREIWCEVSHTPRKPELAGGLIS